MTQQEFARRIVAMQDTLYRVSTTILPQLCDREDAVQGAIEKAWRKQGRLRDDSALRAWVIRILINECYTLLRRRKHETLSDTLPEREVAIDANPDLYQLFTSLDEKYRLPMVLFLRRRLFRGRVRPDADDAAGNAEIAAAQGPAALTGYAGNGGGARMNTE